MGLVSRCVVALGLSLASAGALADDVWILRTDLWRSPAFSTLKVREDAGRVTGTLDGDAVEGSVEHGMMVISGTDAQGRTSRYRLRPEGGKIAGTADLPDPNDGTRRAEHAVSGWKLPGRQGPPRTIEYRPREFSNTWDADRQPVLVVWPGDTIHTSTIDSGGVDEHGVTRALFGNPQTGPFFIAGAEPGDTLVVHIRRLALNRDYADSLDAIVGRALGRALVADAAQLGKPVRWSLDRGKGLARPKAASGALASYAVPVRPMLGGLAVAPAFGLPAISTGDTGSFGGNMDFNEVVEGNTVYLPVQQPGALLYMGDAHALQGDGETTQYALETSMDVTVTVDLIRGRAIAMPRVESPSQIMVLGQAGSLDDALKAASTGMVQWLQQDYGMNLSEAAQVLGTAVHYTVANLAGRSVGVAARIDKRLLPAVAERRPG
jgi:acetamidase/formamidase